MAARPEQILSFQFYYSEVESQDDCAAAGSVKGWMLVRLSLHDPVVAINIEAKTEGATEKIFDKIRPFFKKHERLGLGDTPLA